MPVRRGEVGHGDLLGGDQRQQVGRGDRPGRRQHQRRPGRQRNEDLLQRGVGAQRGQLQHPVMAGKTVGRHQIAEHRRQRAVAHRHRLRLSGRAGGGDDVGDIFRLQTNRRGDARILVQVQLVQENEPGPGFRECVFRGPVGQNDRGARVGRHPGQPRRGQRRVHRQIGAARREYPEQGANRIPAAFQARADHRSRAHAPGPQRVGQLAGRPLKLPVGQPVRAADRRGTGIPCRQPPGPQTAWGIQVPAIRTGAVQPRPTRVDAGPGPGHQRPAGAERQRSRPDVPAGRNRPRGRPDRILARVVEGDDICVFSGIAHWRLSNGKVRFVSNRHS